MGLRGLGLSCVRLWGLRLYQEPRIADKQEVGTTCLAARANKAGAWILALQEKGGRTYRFWLPKLVQVWSGRTS
eukprot:4059982-Amphidinium_carterae.1